MNKVLDLHHHLSEGKLLLRDEAIPQRNTTTTTDIVPIVTQEFGEENNDMLNNYDCEAVWNICDQSQSLLDADSKFRKDNNIQELQRSLVDLAGVLKQGSNYKYQTMIGLAGELNRITEDNEKNHENACDDLRKLIQKYTRLNVTQHTLDNDSDITEVLHFPETGYNRKRVEKN